MSEPRGPFCPLQSIDHSEPMACGGCAWAMPDRDIYNCIRCGGLFSSFQALTGTVVPRHQAWQRSITRGGEGG